MPAGANPFLAPDMAISFEFAELPLHGVDRLLGAFGESRLRRPAAPRGVGVVGENKQQHLARWRTRLLLLGPGRGLPTHRSSPSGSICRPSAKRGQMGERHGNSGSTRLHCRAVRIPNADIEHGLSAVDVEPDAHDRAGILGELGYADREDSHRSTYGRDAQLCSTNAAATRAEIGGTSAKNSLFASMTPWRDNAASKMLISLGLTAPARGTNRFGRQRAFRRAHQTCTQTH
jgi:hypothetical protein